MFGISIHPNTMYVTANFKRNTGYSGATDHGIQLIPTMIYTKGVKQKQGYLLHIKGRVAYLLHIAITH